MQEIRSKLQFGTFETGEFTEEKVRSYEDTIKVIEEFPWKKERANIVIALTNPSITLQNKEQEYLKLAIFFNEKFVLHFIGKEQKLYTQSFSGKSDSYPIIQQFFKDEPFDLKGFKLENTWLQHPLKHFVTQDFHYRITPESTKKFLLRTSSIPFAFTIFMLLMIIFSWHKTPVVVLVLILLPAIFLIGGGLNLLLYFNYLSVVKGKELIMSNGNATFYFGDAGSLNEYSKSDIRQVIHCSNNGTRSVTSRFAFVAIQMINGEKLFIPNLLVDDSDLMSRLWMCNIEKRNKFPYIIARDLVA